MFLGVQLYRGFDAAISLLLFILEKHAFSFIAFPVDAYGCPRRLCQERIDPKTSYNAKLSVFRARYLNSKHPKQSLLGFFVALVTICFNT